MRRHPYAHVPLLCRPMDECQVILHLLVSMVPIHVLQILWESNPLKVQGRIIHVDFLNRTPICGSYNKHHEWVCKHGKVDQESAPVY